jgi:hypothetical protein
LNEVAAVAAERDFRSALSGVASLRPPFALRREFASLALGARRNLAIFGPHTIASAMEEGN